MELVLEKPLESFIEQVQARPTKELVIASPFISQPGARIILDCLKRKKTTVRLLTNLSEFNLLLSLNNPIKPLRCLQEILGDRLTVATVSNLHAKLFMADSRYAISGSSNLTLGGSEKNYELNWSIDNRTAVKRDRLLLLTQWFNFLWGVATKPSDAELVRLEELWTSKSQKMLSQFKELIPTPRLAGDQWQKVKEITAAKSMKKEQALEILSRLDNPWAEDEKRPANAESKLLFLRDAGIIEIDSDRIRPLRKFKKPEEMIDILTCHISGFDEVLDQLKTRKEQTYGQLEQSLNRQKDDPDIRSAALWLEDLGMLKRRFQRQGQNILVFTGK